MCLVTQPLKLGIPRLRPQVSHFKNTPSFPMNDYSTLVILNCRKKNDCNLKTFFAIYDVSVWRHCCWKLLPWLLREEARSFGILDLEWYKQKDISLTKFCPHLDINVILNSKWNCLAFGLFKSFWFIAVWFTIGKLT